MARGKLTKRTVDAVKAGLKKYILWDETLSGFGLKVTPAGNRVYVFQYRIAAPGAASVTPPKLWTIGSHGSPWTPTMAREEAERLALLVARGIDPKERRREQYETALAIKKAEAEHARIENELRFEIVAERWLATLLPAGKSKKYYETSRWAVRTYLIPVIGTRPLPQITPDDIQRAIDAVAKERASTRLTVHDTTFAIYRWAKGTGGGRLVSYNVAEDVDRPPKPESRKRVLADSELALIWVALSKLSPIWAAFYKIAILTGKRRSEIAKIQWSELDRSTKAWLLAGDRTKNKQADLVPLSDAVIEIFDELAASVLPTGSDATSWPTAGYVLTNDGKAPIGNHSHVKKLLDAAITEHESGKAIPQWVLHDFRRTLATGAQRSGVRLEVTEALLNHKGKSRGGIVAVYQLHDWKDEKRAAIDIWATHLQQIVTAAQSPNVVQMASHRQLSTSKP